MPEMHFTIEWPDGQKQRCYSPSYVVEEHLSVGASYPASDFVDRTAHALQAASDRVRDRYGFACSSALDQLSEIQEKFSSLTAEQQAGRVVVQEFEKHPARDARAQSRAKGEVA